MRCGILTTVALGLLFCPQAAAQQRQVVYVDIDLAHAKELAERPRKAVRVSMHDALRDKLVEKLKEMMPKCWDFQALRTPPAGGAWPVIRIRLVLSSSDPSTRRLEASVVLTDTRGGAMNPLHSQPLTLWGAGEVQGFIESDAQTAFADIPEKFQLYFIYQIAVARKLMIDYKVPIASGLALSLPGGAVLPIDYYGFQRNCASLFEIRFLEKAGTRAVTIIAEGIEAGYSPVGGAQRLVQVRHRLWETLPYDSTAHDTELAKFNVRSIYLKELRYGGITNSDY